MYRTEFWTLGEGEGGMFRENSIETCILSTVKQITSPGWIHDTSARAWCTGKTQRRGRWEGGSGWRILVNPWLIHVNVWQKPLQYCKVISLQLIKWKKKKAHWVYLRIIAVFSNWKDSFLPVTQRVENSNNSKYVEYHPLETIYSKRKIYKLIRVREMHYYIWPSLVAHEVAEWDMTEQLTLSHVQYPSVVESCPTLRPHGLQHAILKRKLY